MSVTSPHTRRSFLATTATTAVGAATVSGVASADEPATTRFAQFNVFEFGTEQVQQQGDDQAAAAARIIQEVQPDVFVLNELTNNLQEGNATDTPNAEAFLENYLSVPQKDDLDPLEYPHYVEPEVNTGVASGMDLYNDGNIDITRGDPTYANDAFGFGLFPGQYGFAIYSRYPIEESAVRTFRKFLWRDMPDSRIPTDPETNHHLSAAETERYRLSSKSHAAVPVQIEGQTVYGLLAHPTPPGFDGPGNFNGKRAFDEVRLLHDIAAGAEYVYDDSGTSGGLPDDASYVLMGDMNVYPGSAETYFAADRLLLDDAVFGGPKTVRDPFARVRSLFSGTSSVADHRLPTSPAGTRYGVRYATAQFGDEHAGNKIDYVRPSPDLPIQNNAVVWPTERTNEEGLAEDVQTASDHRLVWADISVA